MYLFDLIAESININRGSTSRHYGLRLLLSEWCAVTGAAFLRDRAASAHLRFADKYGDTFPPVDRIGATEPITELIKSRGKRSGVSET